MIDKNRLDKSILDDDAELYKIREHRTEKEKIKNMTFKDKLTYFKNYYRNPLLIAIVVIALLASFLYSTLKPTPKTVLYAAVINYALSEESGKTLEDNFSEHLSIDPESENVMIDTSFYIGSSEEISEFATTNRTKLTIYIGGSDIDVIIAPESVFESYAYNETFSKLTDILPTDLCTSLADSLFYSGTEEDSTSSAYGIYLDNANTYKETDEFTDRPVLGIVINSKHKTNAVELIRFMFDLN